MDIADIRNSLYGSTHLENMFLRLDNVWTGHDEKWLGMLFQVNRDENLSEKVHYCEARELRSFTLSVLNRVFSFPFITVFISITRGCEPREVPDRIVSMYFEGILSGFQAWTPHNYFR